PDTTTTCASPHSLHDALPILTNPPIDSIREAVVMSVQASVGSERNLLDETPEHARQLVIDNPILLDAELEQLRQVRSAIFKSHTDRKSTRLNSSHQIISYAVS